jgi:hypothetical protein
VSRRRQRAWLRKPKESPRFAGYRSSKMIGLCRPHLESESLWVRGSVARLGSVLRVTRGSSRPGARSQSAMARTGCAGKQLSDDHANFQSADHSSLLAGTKSNEHMCNLVAEHRVLAWRHSDDYFTWLGMPCFETPQMKRLAAQAIISQLSPSTIRYPRTQT